MAEPRSHLPQIAPCPFLPVPKEVMRHSCMQVLGRDRGAEFYETALQYAASLWLQGFPAKSLLLINRAFTAELEAGAAVLARWPLPYAAVSWILQNRPDGDYFLGNPRRHYQHLATRMVEPQKERRIWRGWACWYLAKEVLPPEEFPADEKQLVEENVLEPSYDEIFLHLQQIGIAGETSMWTAAIPGSEDFTFSQTNASREA